VFLLMGYETMAFHYAVWSGSSLFRSASTILFSFLTLWQLRCHRSSRIGRSAARGEFSP